MKPLSIIAIAILILFSSQAMQAASVADLAKAQAIIHKINELEEKYREMTIELEAPKSMALYPEMEGRADFDMKNAYKQAAKAAKKKKY